MRCSKRNIYILLDFVDIMHSIESLREIRALEFYLGYVAGSYQHDPRGAHQRKRRIQALHKGDPICIVRFNLATHQITFEDLRKKDVASLTA